MAKLKRNQLCGQSQPDNEQIYYIIDAINDAINAGKQISFNVMIISDSKRRTRERFIKLSPHKLSGGDYYCVLDILKENMLVINFRVDQNVSKPVYFDKDIIPMPDDFDIENYTKEVFFMFS